MSWLLIIGLKNALLVAPLALLALGIGRYSRRPALAHVLWLIVLVKLLTPPLIDVPVGWGLEIESWLATSPAASPTAPAESTIASRPIPANASLTTSPPRATSETSATTGLTPASATAPPARHAPANTHPAPIAAAFPAATSWNLLANPAAWIRLAAFVWLAGSLLVVAAMLLRAWRFHRFLRLATCADARIEARVARLARAAGLGSAPRVVVVEGAVSPMLWGLGSRARLVFPAQLADRLNDAEIDSLLLHELAHFARGDHWVRLLELAAHVLYWWHPVVWFARREIEAAEEQCCDAWVVEHQHGSRRSYAEALLTTIDFLCEKPTVLPPAACGLGDAPLLKVRLTQIMRGQLAAGLSRTVQVVLLIAGLLLSPLEPAAWATSAASSLALPPAAPVPSLPAVTTSPPRATPSTTPAASPPDLVLQPAATIPVTMSIAPPPALPKVEWTAPSPDGRYRLESRKDGTATLVREGTARPLEFTPLRVTAAAFAPDGESFVTGHPDGTVRWWSCDLIGGLLQEFTCGSERINSVAFGPDQRVAAGSQDGSVVVWNLASGAASQRTGLPPVGCVRWSVAGDRLAIGLGHYTDTVGGLLIWNPDATAQAEPFAMPAPVAALQWQDNDLAVLAAQWDGQGLAVTTATGQVVLQTQLEKNAVSPAAWSPDIPLVLPWQARELGVGGAE